MQTLSCSDINHCERTMKLLTFISFKGGAGKTTALMAIASCLLNRGKKIAIFEADDNRPISQWRDYARTKQTWDENCEVITADTLEDFEAGYGKAEQGGYEIALVDSQGGGSELNDTILINSDFVVLPTALTVLDTDETIETFKYVVNRLADEGGDMNVAILKTRVPTGKLTKAQSRTSELLDELPIFTSVLHNRNAFEDMKFRGLLHQTAEQLEQNPADKLLAGNFHTAIKEADTLAGDLLDALQGEN